MHDPWRLLSDILWPEPGDTINETQQINFSTYKNTHFALSYKNKTVKGSIRNNKFHFHKQSAQDLAKVADTFFIKYPQAIIIPIPSSQNREQRRGYQHLLNVLQHSQHKNQVRVHVLTKKQNTPQQSHVSKAIRLIQQQGSFICNQKMLQHVTSPIILFDDVVTTESTMTAAKTELMSHVTPGTDIICFAIAH